jgi:predicted methyltransferase
MYLLKKTSWTLALCVLGGALASIAHAQDEQVTRMRSALASPDRSQENKDRDAARKPIETIQFLGIKTGQSVMDMVAAGGWFTEVLSAAVGPSGKVYTQNPDFFVGQPGFADREAALVKRLGNVTPVHGNPPADLNGKLDAAITALNLHDIYNGKDGETAAAAFVKSAYDALKPGGVFGVIDHVGIAGQDNAKFHRIQIQQARDVLTKAGFKIEAESDILKNPADDHTKGVRDPSVSRHTDQFLIRARKPK